MNKKIIMENKQDWNNNELIQLVEKAWWTENLNEENWVEVMIEAVKYIIDKLILKEQKLSKLQEERLEKLLFFLEEIKAATDEYALFFEENKDEINSILSQKEHFNVLSNDLYNNYPLIKDYYDFINKELLKLLENLKNTSNFFKFDNFSKDDDDKNLVLELLKETEEKESPEEKLRLLEKDIDNLEKIIYKVHSNLDNFSNLLFTFAEKTKRLAHSINSSYIKNTNSTNSIYEHFFGASWYVSSAKNISFKYKESELLSYFFNSILNKIPENYTVSVSFKKDLLKLFSSDRFRLIENEVIITNEQIEILKSFHKLYSKLSKAYKNINDTISKKYESEEKRERFTFEINQEEEDKWYKILDVFKDKKAVFFETLDMLSKKDKSIYKIDKENDTVWSKKERKIKKEIFDILYSIYKDIIEFDDFDLEKNLSLNEEQNVLQFKIQNLTFKLENNKLKKKERKKIEAELEKLEQRNEKELFPKELNWENYILSEDFNRKIFKIIKLYDKLEELIEKEEQREKEISKEVSEDLDTFRHHYSIQTWWWFDTITGFKREEVIKPAKVVWSKAREIIDKIKLITKNAKKLKKIKSTFPWAKDTLEWNLIILWPWWGWKTALLKELSYEKDIITIEVNKSDILNTWLWQTEKNIDALWKISVKLHKQTGKEVFLFFDEMDSYFEWLGLSWGWWPDIQKEFQTRLDWLEDFEWVHFIGLSNVPHHIPIDIYRRMEHTYILDNLDLNDKIDLFYSRLENYPISDELSEFFANLRVRVENKYNTTQKLDKSDIVNNHVNDILDNWDLDDYFNINFKDRRLALKLFIDNLWLNKTWRSILYKLFQTTPKILYQVTEKIFKNYINDLSNKQIKKLNKKIDKLAKKNNKEKLKISFEEIIGKQITMQDLSIALDDVFSNKSVDAEIKWNMKFFSVADAMLESISSSAFDWFEDIDDTYSDEETEKNKNRRTITIIEH